MGGGGVSLCDINFIITKQLKSYYDGLEEGGARNVNVLP